MQTYYPLATETWDENEKKAIQRVVESNRFTMGGEVKLFEKQFAEYFGSKYAVMVNSGSSANLLAIASILYDPRNLIQKNDEVIVPAVSWSTTFYPIEQCGLKLRFIDIDKETLNLDLNLLEKALTKKTKAVLAVNLLGNPCDFDKLKEFCQKHNLILLEDNCESMGAVFNNKQAGTFGLCGTFSTFFSHHISTMEGGMIVTDDETIYHTLLSLRAHGWTREQPENSHLKIDTDDFSKLFRFILPGYNVRPLEMEGAIGQEQLKKLPSIIKERRKNAKIFQDAFQNMNDLRIQKETGQSSWFGFSLVLQNKLAGKRTDIVSILKQNNIECRPIVAGNFLRNPVIKHLNHSIGSSTNVADEIDENGLFIGNHHYPIENLILKTKDIFDNYISKI